MIDLYFWTTPNGYKPLLFLEEAGVPSADGLVAAIDLWPPGRV